MTEAGISSSRYSRNRVRWPPELGASGAIAAVLGACFMLDPASRVLTYIVPVFVVRIPAWVSSASGSCTS